MKLKHISLIGIDEKTDLKELQILQDKYPLVEFGVIMSKNWKDNGNRYWNPDNLEKLKDKNLNLSLHLCGSLARSAILNDWNPTLLFLGENINLFKRAQLNISTNKKNPENLILDIPKPLKEVIIQQKGIDGAKMFLDYYQKTKDKKVSILLDSSGGLGIDTPLIPLDIECKVGYAGGFGPDNILEKTCLLLNSEKTHDFWVDMESKIRTNDWFDIKKAYDICQKVYSLL